MVEDEEEDRTVWVRSIRYHTYTIDGARTPQPEDSFYAIKPSEVENIVDVLKFAVREQEPRKAVRQPSPVPPAPAEARLTEPADATTPPPNAQTHEEQRRPKAMTTRDLPTRRRKP